jgi:hypothetical protein
MDKTRAIAFGGIMTCTAVLLQCLPVFLTEAFVILTMLSALPIYIVTRIDSKTGIAALIASFILISLFSTHEALFFIFTNGPIGVVLGTLSCFKKKKSVVVLEASLVMTFTISIMNFLIGIPIFGTPIPGNLIIQIIILIMFSIVYSTLYLYFCEIVFNKIRRLLKLKV